MPTTVLLNEKELLLLVAHGDKEAYRRLFTHYWDKVFSTALLFTKSKEIAQDLAQDIFAHIWVKKEKLTDVDHFEAYLFITSRNLIIDRLRKKVFSPDNESYLQTYFEQERLLAPDFQMELKEMEAIIHKGMRGLPYRQRVAFYLSRIKGMKHKEIALRMGISQESVKSHIVRASGTLRKYLTEHSGVLPLSAIWFLS